MIITLVFVVLRVSPNPVNSNPLVLTHLDFKINQ